MLNMSSRAGLTSSSLELVILPVNVRAFICGAGNVVRGKATVRGSPR